MEITQESVRLTFEYKEGFLFRKTKNGLVRVGTVCTRRGYSVRICWFNRKTHIVPRLIFLYHKGYLPKEVDHEDRDSLNDKIENLRPATRSENNANRRSMCGSSSKYLGVSFFKITNKWTAMIHTDGKNIRLGYFTTEEEAALAYNKAAVKHHKEFANLNILAK